MSFVVFKFILFTNKWLKTQAQLRLNKPRLDLFELGLFAALITIEDVEENSKF